VVPCDSTAFLFYITLFFGSRPARTGGSILAINRGLRHDVFPRKEVPFGGRDETAPHLGVKFPKTPILGRE